MSNPFPTLTIIAQLDATDRKLLTDIQSELTLVAGALAAIQAAQATAAEVAAANQENMMASIDDVIADVTAETTTIASLDTAIKGIQSMLAAALAGTTVPPAVQAKIDSVFATVEANKGALATALTDSVPPAPTGP